MTDPVGHIGAHTNRHARRIGTDHTATQYQHTTRLNTRHATQQGAITTAGFFQITGAGLHRHASGNFRHGRQQRQTTTGRSNWVALMSTRCVIIWMSLLRYFAHI